MALGALGYLAACIVPGLDRRFGWSEVPLWAVLVADAVVLAGYALTAWVFRVNRYASRVVELADGQQLIASGPYAYVRHPMYAGALLMCTARPVGLGSWWAMLTVIPLAGVFIARLLNEEELLRHSLAGYVAYTARTRYRLVPGLW